MRHKPRSQAEFARRRRLVFCGLYKASFKGKGATVPAESENTADGAVETQEQQQGGGGSVATDGDRLVELYKKMVLIRTFEEATQRGFRQGKIGGYLHVYIGQEAVATGFLDAYKEGDRVITAYRDHPHVLLLGSDPKAVMAELYGKGTGIVKGKGGSMHLFDVEKGFMGGYGIVGGHIPLGVGFAYAQRYEETDHITQLYLGDGSISNGAFHEAVNLSGLWGKDGMNPCLFIVENNQYGMGTSVERTTAMTDLAAKFDAYGVENEKVDGMDIEAVLEVAHRAADRVRETGKPYAVEALTYRTAPHGAADFFEKYRTKDEIKQWRERDPIGQLEQKLIEREVVDEDGIEEIKNEMKETIQEVVRFADESDEPPLEELYTDVYTGGGVYTGEEG
ncbi:pyruvate dehydrogenase (acetyl-transferring) E1 component subunit alpha [Rubrobacter marinus]|uniref:Pyruvate dehydrogenase (Acetyl-transferring) E1 component subunit alpha n=1 Tax=Rubrobacter marinus TaxID=2653852 RepID=A0A6G8PU34_9ACTN|nr:pyruvate dehydrogenase (acetyl-transferring) E1 component subunit alpha [Rubrobacter marinus]